MTTTNSIGTTTIGGAEGGWWARERAAFIAERLASTGTGGRLAIDLGCGRAELAPILAGRVRFVVACDGERHLSWANRPGRLAYVVADVLRPPFRPGRADLVTALDVIEHFADDQAPLSTLRALVEPTRGRVCVTVPAGPSLWSPFDDEVGHFRRYDAAGLRSACASAGFVEVDATHYFAWLVPPAWLLRRRSRQGADADEGASNRLVTVAVGLVARLERWFLRRRPLPAGTSLWFLGAVDPRDQPRRDRRPARGEGAGSGGGSAAGG